MSARHLKRIPELARHSSPCSLLGDMCIEFHLHNPGEREKRKKKTATNAKAILHKGYSCHTRIDSAR